MKIKLRRSKVKEQCEKSLYTQTFYPSTVKHETMIVFTISFDLIGNLLRSTLAGAFDIRSGEMIMSRIIITHVVIIVFKRPCLTNKSNQSPAMPPMTL